MDVELTTREELFLREFLGENIIFIGSFLMLSFAFVFWVIDVVWQPQNTSRAKRINLKFSLNKLQRKEFHGRKGWEKCVFECTMVCLYVFIPFNVCAYMVLSSSAQCGFISVRTFVCLCVLS